jgi:hypothetical protein
MTGRNAILYVWPGLLAPAVKLLATSAVLNTAATSVHGTSPGAHQTDDTGQPPVLDNKFVNYGSDNEIEIFWTRSIVTFS